MTSVAVRWSRRGAVALAGLLLLGFVVGAVVKDRPAGSRVGERPLRAGTEDAVRQTLPKSGSAGTVTAGVGVAPGRPELVPQAAAAPDAPASLQLPQLPNRIVKNGDLGLEVKVRAFEPAWTKVFQIATRFGGFVASSSRGAPRPVPLAEGVREPGRPIDDDERLFGDITIRVPAARFEAALNELRTLGKVTGDVVSSQDVTEEFVDLESRLRHLRAQEAILLRLMGQAKTISDTLVVQQQLSQVQLQIEEITGRLRVLRSMTDLSTINVHLAEPGAILPPEGPGPSFGKAWDTAVEGLVRIGTTAMIAAAWLAPFLALAVLVLAGRRLRTRPAPTV